MAGRDLTQEAGEPDKMSSSSMSIDEEVMGEATRCVRRFAPEGRTKVQRSDNRHITACKISDANPNEMLVSWSGDHLYSFDIIRSADACEAKEADANGSNPGIPKIKHTSKDRKRKRKNETPSSAESRGKDSKPRGPGTSSLEDGTAIRATYENGDTEDIAMGDIMSNANPATVAQARESIMSESQKRSLQIAKSSVKIRKLVFSLEASLNGNHGSLDPVVHRPSFTSALGFAATCLPEMRLVSSGWRYPVDPDEEDVMLQQTLRGNRNSSLRFVQAAGTLARALGGRLQTASASSSPTLKLFEKILPIRPERPSLTRREVFSYTFLKAIILWLDGGLQTLLEGFKNPPNERKNVQSFPIPDDADENAISEFLIPHLLRLAGDDPLLSVDASRFERDETRQIFASEIAAVTAFDKVIRMPLQDHSKAVIPANRPFEGQPLPQVQDKRTAIKYWGFKVGRSLLMKAGEGVDFQYVDIAFGGLGEASIDEDKSRQEINVNEDDPVIKEATLISQQQTASQTPPSRLESAPEPLSAAMDVANADEASLSDAHVDTGPQDDQRRAAIDDDHGDAAHASGGEDDIASDDDNDNDDDDDNDNDDDDEEEEEEEEDEDAGMPYRPAFIRRQGGQKVDQDVPCHPHTRTYRGHCNVKTVKDANFFGLQDEYVISGSDGGHVFIWNKRTSELVNILEGDGEVVNVIQGNPRFPIHLSECRP